MLGVGGTALLYVLFWFACPPAHLGVLDYWKILLMAAATTAWAFLWVGIGRRLKNDFNHRAVFGLAALCISFLSLKALMLLLGHDPVWSAMLEPMFGAAQVPIFLGLGCVESKSPVTVGTTLAGAPMARGEKA